jgi:hypothetical protein
MKSSSLARFLLPALSLTGILAGCSGQDPVEPSAGVSPQPSEGSAGASSANAAGATASPAGGSSSTTTGTGGKASGGVGSSGGLAVGGKAGAGGKAGETGAAGALPGGAGGASGKPGASAGGAAGSGSSLGAAGTSGMTGTAGSKAGAAGSATGSSGSSPGSAGAATAAAGSGAAVSGGGAAGAAGDPAAAGGGSGVAGGGSGVAGSDTGVAGSDTGGAGSDGGPAGSDGGAGGSSAGAGAGSAAQPAQPGVQPAEDPTRVFLTGDKLATLRLRAAGGDPAWAALAARCDASVSAAVEWPEGSDYPKGAGIGEGYQGSGYMAALLDLALCHQIARPLDAAKSAAWGEKAVDILVHMSAPPGDPHYQTPLRDSGYGIRNFGVGMAIGYDWVADLATPALKARLVAAMNEWISKFESSGFLPKFPHANYFAGYFAAKGLAAVAIGGDDPSGDALWTSWLALYSSVVQPYYATHVAGGGWAEGWNYGPLASLNMQLPVLAARTGKGVDLVGDPIAPYSYVGDEGNALTHFAWPSRLTLDDRGLIYAGANPTGTSAYLYTVQSGLLDAFGAPGAPAFHAVARHVRENAGSAAEAWQEFLFWDDSAPESKVEALPTSYLASGMGAVAMRSSWSQDATWASFVAGPYVGSPDSGEEFFDEGSLAIVRGDTPFVVNASGYLMRDVPGTSSSWGDAVYAENWGSSSPPRSIYNVFYNSSGGQTAAGPSSASTHVDRFEDGGAYVFSRGLGLEQLYPQSSGVAAWTRDVLFLRPGVFLVHDRTTTPSPADPRLAFHVARSPAQVASPAPGTSRFDVSNGGTFAGAVTTVFPAGAKASIVNVFNSNKAYRIEVRPATAAPSLDWLTVLDASASVAEVASATPLASTSPGTLGVVLASPTATTVVLFGAGPSAAPLAGSLSYAAPAAQHVITDLPPATAFSVTAAPSAGALSVSITPGAGFTSSAAGVLRFQVSATGAVSAP